MLLKGNAELAQAFIKRFLAMQWFKRMRESKESLEYHVGSINNLIKNYEHSSNQLQIQFPQAVPHKPTTPKETKPKRNEDEERLREQLGDKYAELD